MELPHFNKNLISRIITIGVALCVAEAAWIFISSEDKPEIKDSIQNAVKKVAGADARRKEQLKIQLAVNLYKAKNGALPKTLDQLIPTYLDSIPNDSATGKRFTYSIENNLAYVGAEGDNVIAHQQIDSDKDPSKTILAEAAASNEMLAFVYNPTGKRDPFRPFEYAPAQDLSNKSPLERYDYNEIRLSAVLDGLEQPKAMLEDTTGKGYTATIGTKIGPRGGQIIAIQKDKLIVLETSEDATGSIKTKEFEIKLRGTTDEKKSGKTVQNARARK